MAIPPQATLTGTCTTKLAMVLPPSQATIGLSFTQPSTVQITSFPTITSAQPSDGFTITTTVAPFDISQTGTFNPADGSISFPQIILSVTVAISGSYSTATGPIPINISQSAALVTGLTTGPASSEPLASSAFNDHGSPLQPSGQVTLVGDGVFWDDDGDRTAILGMTDGAIALAGTIPMPTGGNMTTVPNVVGDDVATAERVLGSASLYFEEQKGRPSPRLDQPTVVEQTPPARTAVQKGTMVTCVVDYPENQL
jgi:hypothetical protein